MGISRYIMKLRYVSLHLSHVGQISDAGIKRDTTVGWKITFFNRNYDVQDELCMLVYHQCVSRVISAVFQNLVTFHYTNWLRGVLVLADYNPRING